MHNFTYNINGKYLSDISKIDVLDLRFHGVFSHFTQSTCNLKMINFLMSLDQVDKHAVDYNEIESGEKFEIQLFMQELQGFIENNLSVLNFIPHELIDILCQLTSTRCIYLLHFIKQHNREFFNELMELLNNTTTQSASAIVLRRRLDVFNKAQQLCKIFSGKRLTQIIKIMRMNPSV